MYAKISGILVICLLLPACATIIEGKSQRINVSTNPPVTSIKCNASNSRDSVYREIPNVMEVKRSKSDLVVRCDNAEYSGAISNSSELELWTLGNLFYPFGIIIGPIVDGTSGAMFSYDKSITVPLTAKPAPVVAPSPEAAPITAPAY